MIKHFTTQIRVSLCYLKIVLGIPVGIEDDDCVSGGQIDTETAGSCGKEKAEILGSFGIKVLQCFSPELALNASVESLKRKMAELEVLANQIQHADHLRKDENAMPGLT